MQINALEKKNTTKLVKHSSDYMLDVNGNAKCFKICHIFGIHIKDKRNNFARKENEKYGKS